MIFNIQISVLIEIIIFLPTKMTKNKIKGKPNIFLALLVSKSVDVELNVIFFYRICIGV